ASLVRAAGGLPLTVILTAKYLEEAAAGSAQELDRALEDVDDPAWRLEESFAGKISEYEYRERTLSAAIERSDSRLTADSRHALGALGGFPPRTNTFSREAADDVGEITHAADGLRKFASVELSARA